MVLVVKLSSKCASSYRGAATRPLGQAETSKSMGRKFRGAALCSRQSKNEESSKSFLKGYFWTCLESFERWET